MNGLTVAATCLRLYDSKTTHYCVAKQDQRQVFRTLGAKKTKTNLNFNFGRGGMARAKKHHASSTGFRAAPKLPAARDKKQRIDRIDGLFPWSSDGRSKTPRSLVLLC